jgi:hypothetical protein
MDLSKYKSVKKGAGTIVAKIFNRNRNRQPSDELVKIICEVGQTEFEKNALKKRDERAARD